MTNHPNRSQSKHPAERFIGVLDELKSTAGVRTRPLWEARGPKNTGIAYHGAACLFTTMGQPCGIVYVQIFKSENGFEIYLGAPGHAKREGFEWIGRCVNGVSEANSRGAT